MALRVRSVFIIWWLTEQKEEDQRDKEHDACAIDHDSGPPTESALETQLDFWLKL